MDRTFFGIPLFTLGLVCFGLAVLWCFMWPRDKTPESLRASPVYKPRPVWMQTVLRWSHALVWLLLAVACWCLNAGQDSLAKIAALLAGIMYAAFVVALVKDGQRRKAFEHESTAPPANLRSGG